MRQLGLGKIEDKAVAGQLRKPSGPMGQKVGEAMNRSNALIYDFVLEKMAIQPGNVILEIGYGNGNFFSELLLKAENIKAAGLDFSEKMYEEATVNNQKLIETGRLKLAHGASDNMPFESNSFDKVFCINVVYFWDDPAKHLSEILRVLKPGGKFYAGIRQKGSMEKFPFTRYGFTMYEGSELQAVLEKQGFANTICYTVKEPDVEIKEITYSVESACVAGEKPLA